MKKFYNIFLYILLPFVFALTSCEDYVNDGIPSFIQIDSVNFRITNPSVHGSASSNIKVTTLINDAIVSAMTPVNITSSAISQSSRSLSNSKYSAEQAIYCASVTLLSVKASAIRSSISFAI